MRFLTWNIRFGGIGADRYEYDPATSGKNVKAVGRSLLYQDADVIVLTEYRDAPATGGVLKSMLEAAGYQSHVSNPDLDKNGVLIAFSEGVREHYDVLHADHFVHRQSGAGRNLLLPLAGAEAGQHHRGRGPRGPGPPHPRRETQRGHGR